MRRFLVAPLLGAAMALLGWQATALAQAQAQMGDTSQYTRQTFVDWFEKYKDAEPEFKPGDVITNDQLEKVRPFMLPGYFEQFQKWTDLKMEVVETKHVVAHKIKRECDEKFQKQVKLAEDGAVENYVCGQPFANADIDAGIKANDPRAALKVAWNYDKRWYWRGYYGPNALTTWLRFGGSHVTPELEMPPEAWLGGEHKINAEDWAKYDTAKIYRGGGRFERSLACYYHRAYYSGLPMFPDNNYMLPGAPEANEVQWKEFTGFFSPYDVRGTAFIIKRYSDPRRTDDGWAYVPSLRRVRRISAEVKSDSLMGTEHTLEDFYTFSGRVLEWDWKLYGKKKMLAIHAGTKWDDDGVVYNGPDGWLNDDIWQVREMYVIERFPRDPRHPYTGVFMTMDPETWEGWCMVAFDRKGKLWKIWQWGYQWTGQSKVFLDLATGREAVHWKNVDTVDIQNGRGNLWRNYGGGLPNFSPDYINRLFDLNRLTELHR